MATAQQDILNRYSKVTVIGAGVIGASWTALFLAHGLAVVVNDPRLDVETIVRDYISNNLSTLKELGLPTDNPERKLSFEADLERSVAGADTYRKMDRSGSSSSRTYGDGSARSWESTR